MKLSPKSFARAAQVDGLQFIISVTEGDNAPNVLSRIKHALLVAAGGEVQDFDRWLKWKLLPSHANRPIPAVKVELYGPVAPLGLSLPAKWVNLLHGIDLKAFAPMTGVGFTLLRTDIDLAEDGRQPTIFGRKRDQKGEKGDGRGFRIGSRRADFTITGYKRAGQWPGIEVRIRDAALTRINVAVARTLREMGDHGAHLLIGDVLSQYRERAGSVLAQELDAKGVDLSDYAPGFVDSPWIENHGTAICYDFGNAQPHRIEVDRVVLQSASPGANWGTYMQLHDISPDDPAEGAIDDWDAANDPFADQSSYLDMLAGDDGLKPHGDVIHPDVKPVKPKRVRKKADE